MRRLSTSGPAVAKPFSEASVFTTSGLIRFPITAAVLLMVTLITARYSFTQRDNSAAASPADALGVHSSGGRGCGACHAAHSGSLDAGVSEASGVGLWGRDTTPAYGATVVFGVPENYVEVSPSRVASSSEEVAGILLCLSCHDGNLTPQTMMPSQSYSRKVGLLSSPDRQSIPSFLGDGSFEHPLGSDATITLTDGLVFSNGTFSVTPGSAYARFVQNYGLPVLALGKRTVSYGINRVGRPYLLCTTCHNQHVASVYSSSPETPIDSDGGGRTYRTLFFANGPYNPKFDEVPSNRAVSTAQFCRQCHIDLANEGNNALNIRTVF